MTNLNILRESHRISENNGKQRLEADVVCKKREDRVSNKLVIKICGEGDQISGQNGDGKNVEIVFIDFKLWDR